MNKRKRNKQLTSHCIHHDIVQGVFHGLYEFNCKLNGEPCDWGYKGGCKSMSVAHGWLTCTRHERRNFITFLKKEKG